MGRVLKNSERPLDPMILISIRMAIFGRIFFGDLIVTGCKAVKRIRSSSSLPNGVKKTMDLTGIWELSRAWQTLLDVKNFI